MTELELYKFINDNNIDWHKQDNDGTEDVIVFPSFRQIDTFKKILPPCLFDEGGIECRMRDGYFAIWMKDICEYCGVELEKVFIGDGWE